MGTKRIRHEDKETLGVGGADKTNSQRFIIYRLLLVLTISHNVVTGPIWVISPVTSSND